MEVSGYLHTLTTLPHGKNPQYPLNRRLDGPQKCSGQFGEKRNLLLLPGITPRSLENPAHSLVTILTGLSWLLSLYFEHQNKFIIYIS
jgi:hypothetical protein